MNAVIDYIAKFIYATRHISDEGFDEDTERRKNSYRNKAKAFLKGLLEVILLGIAKE